MEPNNTADSSNDELGKGNIKRPTPRFSKPKSKPKTKAELKDIDSKEVTADNGQNLNVTEPISLVETISTSSASVTVCNMTTSDHIEYEIDVPFEIAEEVVVQSESEETYSVYADPITGRLTVGRHLLQFEGPEAAISVNSNSNAPSEPAPFVVPLQTDREQVTVGLPRIENEQQPTETANPNSQSHNQKRKRKSSRARPKHRQWTPAAGALDPFVAFLVMVDQKPQESLVNWRNRAWRDWERLRDDERNKFRQAAENEEELLDALLKSVPKPITTGQGLFVEKNALEHLSGAEIDAIWIKLPPENKSLLNQEAQKDHDCYKAVLSELLDEDTDH